MDAIERHLAQIEGQVSRVLRSIAENATLPEEDTDMDYLTVCTAIGFLDHTLKEDCATIQSH